MRNVLTPLLRKRVCSRTSRHPYKMYIFFFTPFCCVFFLDSRLTYRREGFPGLLKGHQPYHRVWISIWIYEPRSKARHIPGGVYGAIRYIILSLDADKWNARWRSPNNALVPRRSGPHSMPRCICQGFRPTVVMLCERSSSVTKHQIKKKKCLEEANDANTTNPAGEKTKRRKITLKKTKKLGEPWSLN